METSHETTSPNYIDRFYIIYVEYAKFLKS